MPQTIPRLVQRLVSVPQASAKISVNVSSRLLLALVSDCSVVPYVNINNLCSTLYGNMMHAGAGYIPSLSVRLRRCCPFPTREERVCACIVLTTSRRKLALELHLRDRHPYTNQALCGHVLALYDHSLTAPPVL